MILFGVSVEENIKQMIHFIKAFSNVKELSTFFNRDLFITIKTIRQDLEKFNSNQEVIGIWFLIQILILDVLEEILQLNLLLCVWKKKRNQQKRKGKEKKINQSLCCFSFQKKKVVSLFVFLLFTWCSDLPFNWESLYSTSTSTTMFILLLWGLISTSEREMDFTFFFERSSINDEDGMIPWISNTLWRKNEREERERGKRKINFKSKKEKKNTLMME